MQIRYCKTVKTRLGTLITPEELYDLIIKEYDPCNTLAGQYYEIFDSNETLVKPHFDCERYVSLNDFKADTEEKFLESKLNALTKAFKVDKDQLSIAKDCRKVKKKGEEYMKVSFHFVVKTKKVKMGDLKAFVSTMKDPDIDINVYRQGINKFRMPYTKKSTEDTGSIMRPLTDATRETFKNHLVSYIEGCDLLSLPEQINIKKVERQQRSKKIVSKETLERITGKTVIGNIKQENKWYIFDIDNFYCGHDHSSNHNYICFNSETGEYNIRCHSVSCGNFDQLNSTNFLPIQRSTFDFSHQDIVDTFVRLYGDEFQYDDVEDTWYSWNGTLWQQNKSYFPLKMKELGKKVDQSAKYFFTGEALESVKKQAKILKNRPFRVHLRRDIEEQFGRSIEWNSKKFLITFKNGVYDFNARTFRKSNKEEYINDKLSTGYEYKEPTKEELLFLTENFLNKILPNKKHRDVFMEILATSLVGKVPKFFTIANGCGNNGKSVLMEFMKAVLGQYYYKAHKGVLFEQKTGGNPEVANFHLKRFIHYEEPSEDRVIQGDFIKEITGNTELNARLLFSNDTSTLLGGTHVACCNKKPNIGSNDDAIRNRIVDIEFSSVFVAKESEVDEVNHIYERNDYFSEKEFFTKYNHVMFGYLLLHLRRIRSRRFELSLPKDLEERRDCYLTNSDPLLSWFQDTFERTESKDNFVTLTDIYNAFKRSEVHENLSKLQRRTKYKRSNVEELLRTNWRLKKDYRIKVYVILNGEKRQKRNIFLYWKSKVLFF